MKTSDVKVLTLCWGLTRQQLPRADLVTPELSCSLHFTPLNAEAPAWDKSAAIRVWLMNFSAPHLSLHPCSDSWNLKTYIWTG